MVYSASVSRHEADCSGLCALMISLAPEAHLAPALDAFSPVDRQNASEP